VVHKETNKGRTVSIIESVTGEDRLKEIAVMLAGPKPNDSSVKSAKAFIQQADESKKSSHSGH
jgi:DNA repair ATPase RecN